MLLSVVVLSIFFSCSEEKNKLPAEGIWLAEMEVMDHQILPFNFKIRKSATRGVSMEIYNAEEVIAVDEVLIDGDSIKIKTPVFEGYIAGTFTENRMEGQFIKESLDRIVPFQAKFGEEKRFTNTEAATTDISGIWEADFDLNSENDPYKAKGIFTQKNGRVTGTFRTATGDYRYLDGVMDGDSLKISAFDGAHAFLFSAKATDSSLNGAFYSGNHAKEIFVAKRNKDFELPNADSLTFLKKGYDKVEFSFPDASGKMVSLSDDRFKNKVVLVQIMGTWCPNCLDESKYYVNYLKNNTNGDFEIIALAFEYAKTEEKAFNSIQRLRDRIGVEYPILLAQTGTSDKKLANDKLPMLNHVLSYPTSIFIDKKGAVRKIHTGFNGPATGEKFIEFKNDFEAFVEKLLTE